MAVGYTAVLRPDGLVKVLDFGLAKLTEASGSIVDANASTIDTSLTEPGQVMGSPHYMSPEQARGLDVDGRSDIFSLSAVLYEMIAGRAPFEGATPTDVIIAVVQQEPAPLSHYDPQAPPELQQVVSKGLSKNPGQRYSSAPELVDGLKRVQPSLYPASRTITPFSRNGKAAGHSLERSPSRGRSGFPNAWSFVRPGFDEPWP